jgi:uncharacterized protein with von Willebrand factor type A (vWA) domain
MADRTAAAPLNRLVGFGRYLRATGLPVGTGRILSFCRSAAALDPFDPADLRLAARATLVSRHEDLAALDDAFDRYFGKGAIALPEPPPAAIVAPPDRQEADTSESEVTVAAGHAFEGPDDDMDGEAVLRIVASDVEHLRRKDFSELSEEERRRAMVLVRRLAVATPVRSSRRYRPGPRGSRFDLRQTLRRSLRTEGEPFRRAWKDRRIRRRPLLLILDVSGSMAAYSRPLIEFAHAAALAGDRVEVFCFGTRLTRITRALRTRDPSRALGAVGSVVVDWEGGTRIGESLKELLDRWGGRSALRGSVVVLCSDGLERGDPQLLTRQMERLSRLSHRVAWVNPLAGSPRYEPLARGMAASLPSVDVFLPGHNLESLESLAEALAAK